jgi:hypothetical protein
MSYVKYGRGKVIAMSSFGHLPGGFDVAACVQKGTQIIFLHDSLLPIHSYLRNPLTYIFTICNV